MVSQAVGGELYGTSSKTVVADSAVTVTVRAMVWLSILCSSEVPETGAAVAVPII